MHSRRTQSASVSIRVPHKKRPQLSQYKRVGTFPSPKMLDASRATTKRVNYDVIMAAAHHPCLHYNVTLFCTLCTCNNGEITI